MIALERKRNANVVKAIYRGNKKKNKDKELLLAHRNFLNNLTEKIEFNSSYWKLAKTQLKKETNGKCAYCEANTEVVAHGDVEHYRPKGTYWWLAYTYDNYLYSCQICNQSFKSNNFPIEANRFPEPPITKSLTDQEIDLLAGNISPDPLDIDKDYTLQQYLDHHLAEMALLINPYSEDPVTYFAYEVDDVTQEVKIIPTKSKYQKYVKAAEDYYGLNRIELKNFRYTVFTKFRAFILAHNVIADIIIKNEVKNQINEMISDKYLFAGMNRYFIDKI